MRSQSQSQPTQLALPFNGACTKEKTLQVQANGQNGFHLLKLQTYIANGGNLSRLVRFGDQEPHKISNVVFDMTNPDHVSTFIENVQKQATAKGVEISSEHLIHTKTPLFMILPRGAEYDGTKEKIIFPNALGNKNKDGESVQITMNENLETKRKTHKGFLLVTSHQFLLKHILMNQYDLEIKNAYYLKIVIDPKLKSSVSLQNKLT